MADTFNVADLERMFEVMKEPKRPFVIIVPKESYEHITALFPELAERDDLISALSIPDDEKG